MLLIALGLLIIAAGVGMAFGPGYGVIALGVWITAAGAARDLLTPDARPEDPAVPGTGDRAGDR